MPHKVITEAVFGFDAVIGWVSTGFLFIISYITVDETLSALGKIVGWIGGTGGVFYALLKMHYKTMEAREQALEARSKRKQADHRLEEMEDDEQ